MPEPAEFICERRDREYCIYAVGEQQHYGRRNKIRKNVEKSANCVPISKNNLLYCSQELNTYEKSMVAEA